MLSGYVTVLINQEYVEEQYDKMHSILKASRKFSKLVSSKKKNSVSSPAKEDKNENESHSSFFKVKKTDKITNVI